MPKCLPNRGGCWFCHTDDPKDLGWWFCCEFDTNVHVQCVIDADARLLSSDPMGSSFEDEIIVNEFRKALDSIYTAPQAQNPVDNSKDCGC